MVPTGLVPPYSDCDCGTLPITTTAELTDGEWRRRRVGFRGTGWFAPDFMLCGRRPSATFPAPPADHRSIMKFRTCLLAACMIVVPAVAMFSHHVPATARQSVRTCLQGWIARLVPGASAPSCDATAGAAASAPAPADAPVSAIAAAEDVSRAPAASGAGPAASADPFATTGEPAQVGITPQPAGMTAAHGGISTPRGAIEPAPEGAAAPHPDGARSHAALPGTVSRPLDPELHQKLTDLGARAVECVALPGAAGRCLASCRVPLDPAGQLQRVFQAEGADPAEATGLLIDEVVSWQRRMVERRAAHGPGAGPGASERRL